VVEHLPGKFKVPSLNPSATRKKERRREEREREREKEREKEKWELGVLSFAVHTRGHP
jgi:hypothetical protein